MDIKPFSGNEHQTQTPENPHHRLETHSSGQPNDSSHDLDIYCGRPPPPPPPSSDTYLMVHRLDPLILWLQVPSVRNSVPTQPVLYQVCVFRFGQDGWKVL